MLKGKRVLLRPVKRSDASLFLRWNNDQEVTEHQVRYLPDTEIAIEKWIEGCADATKSSSINFVIEEIGGTSSKPVGHVVLRDINNKDQNARFGIAIGEKECWGKGLGTEATQLLVDYGFKQLNLHRITAHVSEFNEVSIKMHKKVGFKEEGRLRQARFKNGQFGDDIVFGILRDEW